MVIKTYKTVATPRKTERISRRRLFSVIFIILANLVIYEFATTSRSFARSVREVQRLSVDWEKELTHSLDIPTYHVITTPPIAIISLRRTPTRRAELVDMLATHSIKYEVFDAVDGLLEFNKEDLLKYAGTRKQHKLNSAHSLVSQPEILHERFRFACYLSHVRLWERLAASKLPYQVILEDDAILVDGFYYRLKQLISDLPNDWGIFYLDSCHTLLGKVVRSGIRQVKGALCTHGYAISSQGATKLLKRTALRSEKPVDHMLDEAIYSTTLKAYHAEPSLVFSRGIESTLSYPT